MSNYTVQVDIMTDGNRRMKSTAGVLNQRYMIQLKGNHQEIEVSSNMERIKETVRFKLAGQEVWYTLKTTVDGRAEDGSGIDPGQGLAARRARAGRRGTSRSRTRRRPSRRSSPGIFGFAIPRAASTSTWTTCR